MRHDQETVFCSTCHKKWRVHLTICDECVVMLHSLLQQPERWPTFPGLWRHRTKCINSELKTKKTAARSLTENSHPAQMTSLWAFILIALAPSSRVVYSGWYKHRFRIMVSLESLVQGCKWKVPQEKSLKLKRRVNVYAEAICCSKEWYLSLLSLGLNCFVIMFFC